MTSQTIRELALRRIGNYLEIEGCQPSRSSILATGIERILADLGVRLPNRPPAEDPNAIALAPKPEPGDGAAGAAYARAQLAAARERNTPPETAPEPLPPLPEGPE